MDKKYDVGVLGVWSGCNYGSVMTYYALHEILKSFGLSVLMVDKINASDKDPEMSMHHARRFANEHYEISDKYNLKTINKLNVLCDTFVVGSDQVWNYGIRKNFGNSYYLDFAESCKKKISYATSFGHAIDFTPPEEQDQIKLLLKKFDAISVRESDGVKLCKSGYDVDATQVLDPVFLCELSTYNKLAEKSALFETEPFIATYILDPTPEKRAALLHLSEKMGCKLINMLDGIPWKFDDNKKLLDLDHTVDNLQVEDWLYCIKNCSFFVTDSCHGASFAIIYNKSFICIGNRRRGMSRFQSLLGMFELKNRLVLDSNQIISNEALMKEIDYTRINQILYQERVRSLEWLHKALVSKKSETVSAMAEPLRALPQIQQNDTVKRITSNEDFIKVKLLVTLLRDYGIRHIVMSPGGRTVLLSHMFEHNSKHFSLHFSSEERSAGYFAMGLASKLRSPVAMMCTSGTAACNYLPAITEAFYTGIPLIAITADRYQVYLNQNEDQMVPQEGMFDKVIKKSCNLINASGVYSAIEHRRKISECILECTHNRLGPVHINVPIFHSEIGMNAPEEVWALPTKIHPHIVRLTQSEGADRWGKWVQALRESKRILIVYGQNNPPSVELQHDIERFANKYNCVISTDHISNLHCAHSVRSYRALKQIDQEYFNKELSPSIMITVGGHRIMNDPLLGKVRRGLKSIRHWSVMPSGEICDTYFKLTTVLECSQEWFFKYFADQAGDIQNDGEFYKKWETTIAENSHYQVENYNHVYTLCRLMERTPKHSLFHLGVGTTFIDAQRFPIDSSVEVFCNMGTNGIDGTISTFMGQVEATQEDTLCFLAIGDLSFFYDMNGIWNKNMKPNIRIMMTNNSGTALLRGKQSMNNRASHSAAAMGWVKSLGFEYMSATNKEEFEVNLERFVDPEIREPIFFEVFVK